MAIDTQNSVEALKERNRQTRLEVDKLVERYCSGVNTEHMNMTTNFGQLVAVIADAQGNILQEKTPFGSMQPAVIVQAQTWQCADAINQKLGILPGAAKFMAWRWSKEDGRYVPDRTKYQTDGSIRIGDKGVIDDVIVRHLMTEKRVAASPIAGVTELDLLKQEIVALTKHARAHKSETDKSPNGLQKDASRRVTKYWAHYMRSVHADPREVSKILQAEYIELFPKQQ